MPSSRSGPAVTATSTGPGRPSPGAVIAALHRATHSVALLIARERALGVDQGEAHILAALAELGPSPVERLHRALAHRRSTLTSILDRLEGKQLVRRDRNPADGRSLIVALTPDGRRVAVRVRRLFDRLESGLRRQFPDVPHTTLYRIFEHLADQRPEE